LEGNRYIYGLGAGVHEVADIKYEQLLHTNHASTKMVLKILNKMPDSKTELCICE
jgi:hypothetical protein